MAKKRFYQSKKDRRDEHMGMETYERGPVIRDKKKKKKENNGYNYSPMIKADWSAPALLPQEPIQKYYEKPMKSEVGYMDDLYKGVSIQMKDDAKRMRKYTRPAKY